MQGEHGNAAARDLVQLKADPGQEQASGPEAVAIAAHGVEGPGLELPHLAAIQESFGAFDVSDVDAHVGGPAAAAAGALGARAFALGDSVGFADPPDLHTAAHEAAHVARQDAGVQLLGGDEAALDEEEALADEVADTVVAGDSSEELLAGGSAGAAADEVDALIGELDAARGLVEREWFALHHRVRAGDLFAYRDTHNTLNGHLLPLEQRYLELMAEGGEHTRRLELAGQAWERFFLANVNLQTFAGEPLSGSLRMPALEGDGVREHLLAMSVRLRRVGEAYHRVRTTPLRAEAQQVVEEQTGNGRIFLRHLLMDTSASALAVDDDDSFFATDAWAAVYPQYSQRADVTGTGRAQAEAEDRGVSPDRTGVLEALADELEAELERVFQTGGRLRASTYLMTLESAEERRAFLAILDVRGVYDEAMTYAGEDLRTQLQEGTGRSDYVDLIEVSDEHMAELFSEMARNAPSAVCETASGFYSGLGGALDDVGLGFLGDVMKDAGASFDDLAGELDNQLGNEDTEWRTRIAHITGNVEAALFQQLVTGQGGTAFTMVQMSSDAANLLSTGEQVMAAMQDFGARLRHATGTLRVLQSMGTGAVQNIIDLWRAAGDGATSEELLQQGLGQLSGDLAGFLELPAEQQSRERSEQRAQDSTNQADAATLIALDESGLRQTVLDGNAQMGADLVAARHAQAAYFANPTPEREAALQAACGRVEATRARVRGEIEAGAAAYQAARAEAVDALSSDVSDASEEGLDLRDVRAGLLRLWRSIVAIARAALTSLLSQLVQELVAFSQSDDPTDTLPDLGSVVSEAAKSAAEQAWDEVADPVVAFLVDKIGDLVDHVGSELAELGTEAILSAIWAELGGDLKKHVIDDELKPTWEGIAAEIQRSLGEVPAAETA